MQKVIPNIVGFCRSLQEAAMLESKVRKAARGFDSFDFKITEVNLLGEAYYGLSIETDLTLAWLRDVAPAGVGLDWIES